MRRVAICEACDLYAVIGKYVEMDLSFEGQLEFDSRYALSQTRWLNYAKMPKTGRCFTKHHADHE